jgi:hypothetical protein
VYQSFFANQRTDDGFRRAREVFVGLMGVLGTIVGFYFGSAERPIAPLEIAPIRVVDKLLITHVSGGTPPYRYEITSDNDFKKINKVSDDGWIIEVLEQPPSPGSTIIVVVTDGKQQTASKSVAISATSAPSLTPPAPPPAPS